MQFEGKDEIHADGHQFIAFSNYILINWGN